MYEVFEYGAIPYTGMSNQETIEKVLSGYRMSCPGNKNIQGNIFIYRPMSRGIV
jgi:hypothetical protein